MIDRMPAFAGYVTLVAGAALLVAPRRSTRLLGLDGEEAAVRAIGVSDLVLVPGLLRGNPRWPWMLARAGLNVADAAYLHRVAPRSTSPAAMKAGAAAMMVLTAVDGTTALALRRAGR
jgi:hypothetical protein